MRISISYPPIPSIKGNKNYYRKSRQGGLELAPVDFVAHHKDFTSYLLGPESSLERIRALIIYIGLIELGAP
jgi:hypothetical protein